MPDSAEANQMLARLIALEWGSRCFSETEFLCIMVAMADSCVSSTSNASDDSDSCLLCGEALDSASKQLVKTEKGLKGLQASSKKRGDNLSSSFFVGQYLHKQCRNDYTNEKCIQRDLRSQVRSESGGQQESASSPVKLRNHTDKVFNYKTDCVLCGHPITEREARDTEKVHTVRSFRCDGTLLDSCDQRGAGDKWAQTVRARIEAVNDLHAADARYHQQCSSNFRTHKTIPVKRRLSTSEEVPTKKRGTTDERVEAFFCVADYLQENDDEQITLDDLQEKMQEILVQRGSSKEAYTTKTIKKKLEDHFKEDIIVTCIRGKQNVVTLRTTADKILRQFSKEREKGTNNEEEKQRIVKTAAQLILSDLKAIDTSKEEYTSSRDVADLETNLKYVPPSLRTFLGTLFGNKKSSELKTASLGQAIIQSSRPKVVLAPMLLGLAVELHHLYASKYLVEHLSKLGFSISYNEAKRFEQNAAISQGVQLDGITPGSSVQFVADNVDHNIRTLDGTGTFHGMGLIAAITPAGDFAKTIPRDNTVSAERVKDVGRIPIKFWNSGESQLQLAYEVLPDFSGTQHNSFLDLVWSVSWPFRSPRPGWSGTMQAVSKGSYPGKTQVTFLPMIDMDPSDMSCVYTTLHFISSLADRYKIKPVVTFDQPLWWKARVIVASEPVTFEAVVVRLGGFHTEMSFLGCIGHLMAGSGLQQVLEVIFAPNAVTHILSGKSVARAVRGHFLVYAVLHALLTSQALNLPLPEDEDVDPAEKMSTAGQNDDLQAALKLFDQLLDGTTTPSELVSRPELARLRNTLLQTKAEISDNRTSRLWLQYMDMVEILRRFLRAERTGNWLQHLQAMKDMLPYLAAAGHNLYTKSLSLYLQDMHQLQTDHPDVHKQFLEGHHVLRRSDRFWAGLSADLIIEQMLMRSVKSAGGLTRGRGMSEALRAQWLLSMPACGDMNNAMQQLTGMDFITSDQHAESTTARLKKDDQDLRNLFKFLLPRNPFAFDLSFSLRNICTGIVADPTTNVDSAKSRGESILKDMVGKKVTDFKFLRTKQAVTMDIKRCAKVDGEHLHVDPQLLFQRLLAAARGQTEDGYMASVFEFELAVPPASLFEPSGLLREATKSKLTDSMPHQELPTQDDGSGQYVLDGGSLLHRITWRKGDSFEEICTTYKDYINRHFPRSTVVFDGYGSEPTTKDQTHRRRTFGATGPEVRNFNKNQRLSTPKHVFLSNATNKQAFVYLLGETLEDEGCKVFHATDDADTLIVKKALENAKSSTTFVVGEDTDLLVLLCHHTGQDSKPVFLRTYRTNMKQKQWHIQQVQQHLQPEICELLPFLHAVNGCDTTSRLFGIGKGAPLKKIQAGDQCFKKAGRIFCSRGQNQQTIAEEGEKALVSLLGGKPGQSLDTLRYHRFCEKVATVGHAVQVQTLPPTSSAAKYHCLRVYLQVQEWINLEEGLEEERLDPVAWGWTKDNNRLEPKTTDLPPAPEGLLRVIRCDCKAGCKTKQCTCRKFGLDCSLACGECKGLTCSNCPSVEEIDMPDLFDSTDMMAPLPDLGDISDFLQ